MSGFGYHGQNPPADAAVRGNQAAWLSVLAGNVPFARSDPRDERQDSSKFMRLMSALIQDDEGNPVFFLENKANDVVVENIFGQSHPPVAFNPVYLAMCLMLSGADDVGNGFRRIRGRKLNNTRLNTDHGGVHDGSILGLLERAEEDYKSCKTLRWGKEAAYVGGDSPRPTVRISCMSDQGLSATVRKDTVVLEPTNPRDECQHWIKDMRHGALVKDAEGHPAFALVNKFTCKAIKPSSQGEGHPVELVKYRYIPGCPDESVLWTEGRDMAGGFGCIRMATNIRHKFGALNGGKATKHSQCFDHPLSNHYCPSCLQKRVCSLL